MHILVTGALGHIGSRLIRDLPALFPGAETTLVDNLSTQRYCSLFNLPAAGRYRFLEEVILEADLGGLLRGVDVVVHLAAVTDAASSFSNREQVERVNFDATERVARACAANRCGLVFLSTTSVYGTQNEVVDESCAPEELRPQSPYAEAKLRAERMLLALRGDGLRFVTLRFGTIFGVSSGMRFHTAVNKFIWQACLGRPITVWRTALEQRRPYLDLSDAVRALAFVIDRRAFDGSIYNVLTTNTTVREIVEVIKATVPDLQIELVDTPIMNQLSYAVSPERFRSLGFRFEGDLSRSVRESIAMLRQARST